MIFDKPTSVDLLAAISHFLDTKIKPEVPAHLAFKIRNCRKCIKYSDPRNRKRRRAL